MDYFAHRAPGRRGDKNATSRRWGKNVTLMNILRELLSAAKTVEVEENIYPKKLKGSGALQLSALLRQSQHTPAKLFLNNHPAVLKAVKSSLFFVCFATSVPLSLGGRCSLDGAVVPLWQRQLLTSGSPPRLQHSLGFLERPFCPVCRDVPSANDDVPFCVLCSCFSCVTAEKKKEKLRKIFMISLHGWKILKGYA